MTTTRRSAAKACIALLLSGAIFLSSSIIAFARSDFSSTRKKDDVEVTLRDGKVELNFPYKGGGMQGYQIRRDDVPCLLTALAIAEKWEEIAKEKVKEEFQKTIPAIDCTGMDYPFEFWWQKDTESASGFRASIKYRLDTSKLPVVYFPALKKLLEELPEMEKEVGAKDEPFNAAADKIKETTAPPAGEARPRTVRLSGGANPSMPQPSPRVPQQLNPAARPVPAGYPQHVQPQFPPSSTPIPVNPHHPSQPTPPPQPPRIVFINDYPLKNTRKIDKWRITVSYPEGIQIGYENNTPPYSVAAVPNSDGGPQQMYRLTQFSLYVQPSDKEMMVALLKKAEEWESLAQRINAKDFTKQLKIDWGQPLEFRFHYATPKSDATPGKPVDTATTPAASAKPTGQASVEIGGTVISIAKLRECLPLFDFIPEMKQKNEEMLEAARRQDEQFQ